MKNNLKSPFTTIISPIRNEEKHIAQCLASLINQDYPKDRYEILVADGMSTDKTRTIVKNFQKKYKNIKLLDNHKKIVPVALNIGLKYATGDVIIRVDGHSIIAENYLSKCIEYLNKTKADCVGGMIESINETKFGKAIALAMSHPFGVGNARFRTSTKPGFVDTLAFGAYRREIFQKIGLFDETLVRCQDDEFNYRLRKSGGKIYLTPEIQSKYYPRANIKKLTKQYFQYGLWKIRVMQKHFEVMQLRQFIPFIFVLSFAATGILSFFIKPFSYLFWFILGSYVFATFVSSLDISIKKGFRYFIILHLIFPILHFSYGFGFFSGLIRFANRWKQFFIKTKSCH